MTMKKTTINIAIFTAINLLFMTSIYIAVDTLLVDKKKATSPQTTPTKQISSQQSIGGEPHNNNNQETSGSNNKDEKISQDRAAIEQLAPKHAEIKRSVTQEYPYYALRQPNDPYAADSWSLQAMQLPAAWDTATGNGVIVAVIDTGFGLSHEDLVNQWYSNTDEAGMTQSGDQCWTGVSQNKAANNCDDDVNGYIDDYRGWDFVNSNNMPQPGETNPTGQGVSHGTEVAGLVGMTGDNAKGSAAPSWSTTIMPLQALSDDGSGYTSDVVAAIYYAVDNGAKVINMSLGGYTYDPALQTAINYAYERDVVVVAAAGNCGTGQEFGCDPAYPGRMSYPARSTHVISVGATNSANTKASFSSYGDALDVVAPGSGSIVTPLWQQANQTTAYAGTIYGTSFSSPYVASVAALIKSIRPTTSVDDMTALINGTATKLGSMNGAIFTTSYGHGVVNAASALQVASSLNTNSSSPELLQAGGPANEHTFTASNTLGSGCKASVGHYCTVRFTHNSEGYERYLPYSLVGVSGQTGWTWSGSTLGIGEWSTHAVQGENVSQVPYMLSYR